MCRAEVKVYGDGDFQDVGWLYIFIVYLGCEAQKNYH